MSAPALGGTVVPFDGTSPVVADDAVVMASATLVGDVHVGSQASIWFGCVLRGDSGAIRVGARTNVQDNCVVHGSTLIGEGVVVAHAAVVHSCRIGDGAVLGMRSVVMGGAVIGAGAFVAAGTLVPPGMVVPPHAYVRGFPGRIVGSVDDVGEWPRLAVGADHYVDLSTRYRVGP